METYKWASRYEKSDGFLFLENLERNFKILRNVSFTYCILHIHYKDCSLLC